MIKMLFNRTEFFIETPCTLSAFLEKNVQTQTPFAIALNDRLVQRADYDHTLLKENDVIDMITPMQGG